MDTLLELALLDVGPTDGQKSRSIGKTKRQKQKETMTRKKTQKRKFHVDPCRPWQAGPFQDDLFSRIRRRISRKCSLLSHTQPQSILTQDNATGFEIYCDSIQISLLLSLVLSRNRSCVSSQPFFSFASVVHCPGGPLFFCFCLLSCLGCIHLGLILSIFCSYFLWSVCGL
jgi:hypothetical protein